VQLFLNLMLKTTFKIDLNREVANQFPHHLTKSTDAQTCNLGSRGQRIPGFHLGLDLGLFACRNVRRQLAAPTLARPRGGVHDKLLMFLTWIDTRDKEPRFTVPFDGRKESDVARDRTRDLPLGGHDNHQAIGAPCTFRSNRPMVKPTNGWPRFKNAIPIRIRVSFRMWFFTFAAVLFTLAGICVYSYYGDVGQVRHTSFNDHLLIFSGRLASWGWREPKILYWVWRYYIQILPLS
jgi:hypothetical protein